ncbi:MAG: hypothetical protein KDB80_03715 [Planctomycetes bacterium]|nr:hypothetical protein [Planctomycetota bacterium]
MLDRQRGAAHVPVIVFLLVLILFFAALGFGYVTMERNSEYLGKAQDAQAKLTALEHQMLIYKHYTEDITDQVGEAGEYKGRAGFDYSEYGNPAPLQNVSLPASVKDRIGEFARKAGVPQVPGLAQFFGHVQNQLDASAARVASLETEQSKLEANIAELQTAVNTIKGERDREVADLNSQVAAKDSEFTSALDAKDETIARGASAYNQIREQLTDEKEQARLEIKQLNGEIDVRQAKIASLNRLIALKNAPNDADGMVIEASQAAGRAWINIGRNDMLTRGTTFRITAPDSDEVKAYGTVTQVEPRRAEIRLTGVKNEYDYVVRGDEIHNDLYSPNLRRTIFLLGRFGYPYNKPLVKQILENLGNTVVDEVGPQVDLVLVGQDVINEDGSGYVKVTETDDYKEVLRLGIETATLNKVRDFLTLAD